MATTGDINMAVDKLSAHGSLIAHTTSKRVYEAPDQASLRLRSIASKTVMLILYTLITSPDDHTGRWDLRPPLRRGPREGQ